LRPSDGFTLIEMLIVLIIAGVTLALGGLYFGRYLDRSSAKRAAEMFGQDLTVARNTAYRSRQRVVVDFDEAVRKYVIRVERGDTLFSRSFDDDGEIRLSSVDLQMQGDTLAFDAQGIADLGGAGGPLGRAVFQSGAASFRVSFNSMGASRVDET